MSSDEERQNDSGSEEVESEEEKTTKKGGKRGRPARGAASAAEPKAKRGKPAAAAKAPAKKGAPAAGGSRKGVQKVCNLSKELAAVMGTNQMSRPEVVKKMWSIIKEKNLYDPEDKKFAICNNDLLPVFGVKRFQAFGMMKYLSKHITSI